MSFVNSETAIWRLVAGGDSFKSHGKRAKGNTDKMTQDNGCHTTKWPMSRLVIHAMVGILLLFSCHGEATPNRGIDLSLLADWNEDTYLGLVLGWRSSVESWLTWSFESILDCSLTGETLWVGLRKRLTPVVTHWGNLCILWATLGTTLWNNKANGVLGTSQVCVLMLLFWGEYYRVTFVERWVACRGGKQILI